MENAKVNMAMLQNTLYGNQMNQTSLIMFIIYK